eukprot:CAMPEP_0119276868 /NCGR_PEP_ID=MMETSP1329-20130426/16119_1 /TAXON_ID=114041 /ORGANISM="Genus nov. species nov., Strain RCC1024" /LENGTH=689 /DNA_ID=CAMNT_0007277313 /DNA_START=153 /DNA_END=2219 /DNA_ORIENTATION=-
MADDDAEKAHRRASAAGYSDESQKEMDDASNKLEADASFSGPRSERKCTDVLWLLIIIAHWIAVTYLAFVSFGWIESGKIGQGRPQILTNWIDHNGYICGKRRESGSHQGLLESKPYLYFPNPFGRWSDMDDLAGYSGATDLFYPVIAGPHEDNLASSAYGVCVHKCPNSDEGQVVDYTTCDDGVCDTWDAYKTNTFVNYCIPDVDGLELQDDALEESSDAVFDFFQQAFADVIAARVPVAVCGVVLPFLCGFLYMVLLRVPGVLFVMVWGTLLLVFLVFVALGAVLYDHSEALGEVDDDPVDKDNDAYERGALYLAYAFWALAAAYVCLIVCMRRALNLAMGIVREAARAVFEMMAICLLPFIQGAATVTFLVVWFVYCVYVATAGEKKLVASDAFGPLKMPYHSYDITNNQMYALWYLLFDLFWSLEFIAALGQLITATCAATWYFTREPKDITSGTVLWAGRHALVYHAGTAAFGSFIIGVIKWLKAALTYVQVRCERAINSGGDSLVAGVTKRVARAVFCCLRCCLWCLEKCMKFLNKEAYIQTAIFGYDFCKAARKGFFLVLRNLRRVGALETVGNFIFFITKVLVGATCALACYVWMGQYYLEETHSITYPSILAAVMAYHLGAIFVGVVDMVADTLLICFIADEEIYGAGNPDCYAPDSLRAYVEGHPKHAKSPEAAVASDK